MVSKTNIQALLLRKKKEIKSGCEREETVAIVENMNWKEPEHKQFSC